ncbi:winged helix DNA-binding domain-containing protein, partial [Patellaria atrata CBS 101060]
MNQGIGFDDYCYDSSVSSPSEYDLLSNGPSSFFRSSTSTPLASTETEPPRLPVGRDGYHREGTAASEKDEPYAKLIFRALKETPGHTMVLKDIYAWFMENTDKASNKESKGWQNSIRHNLSMNGAFQKVDQPPGEEAKKGFMWRL